MTAVKVIGDVAQMLECSLTCIALNLHITAYFFTRVHLYIKSYKLNKSLSSKDCIKRFSHLIGKVIFCFDNET